MAFVFVSRMIIAPWIEDIHAWMVPVDVFTPVPAARNVVAGDVFHMYEPLAGFTGYPYTPLFPILLAPFVAIGDHWHLLGDVHTVHRYPGLFIPVGGGEALLGCVSISVALLRVVPDRRTLVAIATAAGMTSVVYFHPEDAMVVGLLLIACLCVGREQWRGVGVCIAIALLTKQWAMWPALPLLAMLPRGKRMVGAFYAAFVPAIVMAPFLLATPATSKALSGTMATVSLGQRQLWLPLMTVHDQLANADLLRVAWGAVALAVAFACRNRRDPETAIAALGTVMVARLVFEPVLFGYYLVPAVVFALVWHARRGERIGLRAFTAVLLEVFCFPHTYPDPVFFAILGLGLAYVCGPMVIAAVAPNWRPSTAAELTERFA